MHAWPAESTNRSRSGHAGSVGSYRITRVHRTWASGASAMAVPGWPELARCGASMARPRMTLMPSCSRSVSATAPPEIARGHPTQAGEERSSVPPACRVTRAGSRFGEEVGDVAGRDGHRRRLRVHAGGVGQERGVVDAQVPEAPDAAEAVRARPRLLLAHAHGRGHVDGHEVRA